jgi:hypothetical protein
VGIFDYFNGFPEDKGMVIVGVCYGVISIKSDAIFDLGGVFICVLLVL